jgi:uncharacterized protein (TIGR03083 family)
MQFAGVPLRDQDVRTDVTPDESRAANLAQRQRSLTLLTGLPEDDWARPSRCDGWSVQDVVRHMVHMNGFILDGIAAAKSGERFDGFKSFDPRNTPNEWVRAERDTSPAQTLDEFERSTAAVLAAAESLDDAGATLMATPAGRQPWPRALLHGLFDSFTHERDIAVPLDRQQAPGVDLAPVACYQVLLASRIACLVGASFTATLLLAGGPDLTVTVDGPRVEVVRAERAEGLIGRGHALDVLDAMAGRGSLPDALDAPPPLHTALSALSTLL